MYEISREYLKSSQQATQKNVENALSSILITSTAKVAGGLKNAPYKIKKTVRTGTAEYRALNKVCDRSINFWTQSTSFIHAFISSVLAFSRFTHPIVQIMKICMDETADKWGLMAKAK